MLSTSMGPPFPIGALCCSLGLLVDIFCWYRLHSSGWYAVGDVPLHHILTSYPYIFAIHWRIPISISLIKLSRFRAVNSSKKGSRGLFAFLVFRRVAFDRFREDDFGSTRSQNARKTFALCSVPLGFSGSLTWSKSANSTKLTNSFNDDKLTQRLDGHWADILMIQYIVWFCMKLYMCFVSLF